MEGKRTGVLAVNACNRRAAAAADAGAPRNARLSCATGAHIVCCTAVLVRCGRAEDAAPTPRCAIPSRAAR